MRNDRLVALCLRQMGKREAITALHYNSFHITTLMLQSILVLKRIFFRNKNSLIFCSNCLWADYSNARSRVISSKNEKKKTYRNLLSATVVNDTLRFNPYPPVTPRRLLSSAYALL